MEVEGFAHGHILDRLYSFFDSSAGVSERGTYEVVHIFCSREVPFLSLSDVEMLHTVILRRGDQNCTDW